MIDFDDIDNVSPMEDDSYEDGVREDEGEDDMEGEGDEGDDVLGWLDIGAMGGSDSFSNDESDDDWE